MTRSVAGLARSAVARRSVVLLAAASVVWLVPTVSPGGVKEATAASAPQPACRPTERQVVRRVGRVELFERPGEFGLFLCLRGQRYAFEMTNYPERPPYAPRGGPPMMQIGGPYVALVMYDQCGKDPYPCGGPFGFLVDLRYNRSLRRAARFDHTVKVRVNERGSVALMVRDYSPWSEGRFYEEDFPPGPGPFRVDVNDRGGLHTVDSGPGIDPYSLTMRGRRVSWTHDGQPRTTLVTDRAATKSG